MIMPDIFHFTIGPVQGFVAEARRTRDLWAGSFLLSWLSAHAMRAVEDAVSRAGGNWRKAIAFPDVENDELMAALRAHKGGNAAASSPYIGSVPNRFKAEVPETFNPTDCTTAVQRAWQDLTDVVWSLFVEATASRLGNDTKAIWDRQIANFWEFAWVKGRNPGNASDGAWLDERKNWRTHYPEHYEPGNKQTSRYEEGGDHCQLMGFYQELSGYVRAQGGGAKQKAFWDALRKVHGVGELNLRENERLCAVALVKRLFPALPKPELAQVIGWVPGQIEDLDLEHWPSVSYIAAVPWLEEVWRLGEAHCVENACSAYKNRIDELTKSGIFGETEQRILGLEKYANKFFKLDGHFLHRDAVQSMDLDRFKGKDDEPSRNRAAADKALEKLHEDIAEAHRTRRKGQAAADMDKNDQNAVKLPPLIASEFYAVLIADGDEIGKNLRGDKGEENAKVGLARFTRDVPDIIKAQNGVTIYAGGDDVLALLPLDTAIEAAIKLRDAYRGAFASRTSWTLSAAIVFAQYKIPFRAVLEEAHKQLDEIAKEKNGRDSLALAVMKPGGVAFDWVSTWGEGSVPDHMNQMARRLQADREFTTGFLYNIRERYEPLYDLGRDTTAQPMVDDRQFKKFLLAEFRKSDGNRQEAERLVTALMAIGFPCRRNKDGTVDKQRRFSFDAGLVMRFLAEEGRWFMGERP